MLIKKNKVAEDTCDFCGEVFNECDCGDTCEICWEVFDECDCDPADIIAFTKAHLERALGCDVTISLYSEGALLTSTDDE